MTDCYYCGEPFQPKDTAVKLDMGVVDPQDHGGFILSNQRTELVHQRCMGAPDQ